MALAATRALPATTALPASRALCLPSVFALGAALSCLLLLCASAPAQQSAAIPDNPQFNRDVRPILSDRCFFCHGPDSSNRVNNLRLDLEDTAKAEIAKGRFGIVPGDPAQSEVYKRIVETSKAKRMPPAYMGHDALPERDAEIIRRWIAQGAEYQAHWAFIPPARVAPPEASKATWNRHPIDRFLYQRLAAEGLQPSAPASKRTLLRRVYLDLTGLPPTPADVDAFLNDPSPNAYEKVVDRLLASPHYAERMTMRWLDAARYADTNGYSNDGPREMWKWRDWVIEAFRNNMPFDQFTVEQIGGDLLPNATLSQRIATGFHRNHRTSAEGGIVNEEFRVEYVADRAETTGTVWLGLTIGCARCHDHKFDPIPQRDFYSLFAFFNQMDERGFVWNFGNEPPAILAPTAEQAGEIEGLQRRAREAEAALATEATRLHEQEGKWLASALRPGRSSATMDWQPEQALAAHWKLDSIGDARALACTVTRADQPDCGAQPAPLASMEGVDGGAMRFDGKAYLEDKAEPRFNYRDPFTFSLWMRPEAEDAGILSKGIDDFEEEQHGLYLLKGKLRLHATFRWSDLAMRLETKRKLPLGQWSHVAVTYDGSMQAAGVRFYVNGEQWEADILFDQFIWPMNNKEPWRLGAAGGMRMQGLLDEVRIYQRALSADEVRALSVLESLPALAAIPAEERSPAQRAKVRLAHQALGATKAYREALSRAEQARSEFESYRDAIPTTMVMHEPPGVRETFVLDRGAYDAPAEKVEAAVPSALLPLPADQPRNRLGLARWLVSRDNPLTARVTVNRLWAMLFGTGIVKTVEDFGSQGEWPVHPELLDWLAVEFMDSGWDLKHMLKLMVTSAAYRQSSQLSPELLEHDPENRLLARGPRFRLPAEAIRDQALAVSGLLVDKQGGPPVKPYQPPGLWQELAGGKGYEEDAGEGLYRRSLYTYWRRTVAPPMMVNFDSSPRETCVVHEVRTNTPMQALNLMNDVTFVEAARKLAERLLQQTAADDAERLGHGYRLVLARDAKASEHQTLERALNHFRGYYREHPADAAVYLASGKSALPSKRDDAELAAWTAVASILLNLDETVTKE
jgi:hypothetical protein